MIFLTLLKRAVISPVLSCRDFAAAVAQGNLDSTLGYSSRNEIGALARALKTMLGSLRERIAHAEESSAKVARQSALVAQSAAGAEAAKQEADSKSADLVDAASALEGVVNVVSCAAQQLSVQVEQSGHDADAQAARVAEAAEAMEAMSRTVVDVSQNAAIASQMSVGTKDRAARGAELVGRVVGSIRDVQRQSSTLKEDMKRLAEQA